MKYAVEITPEGKSLRYTLTDDMFKNMIEFMDFNKEATITDWYSDLSSYEKRLIDVKPISKQESEEAAMKAHRWIVKDWEHILIRKGRETRSRLNHYLPKTIDRSFNKN